MRKEVLSYAVIGALFSLMLYVYFLLSWKSTYASSSWPAFPQLAAIPFFVSSRGSTRVTAGCLVVLTLICCLAPRKKPLPRAIGLCLGVSVCMAFLFVAPFTFRRRLVTVVLGYLLLPPAAAFFTAPIVGAGYLLALPFRPLLHRRTPDTVSRREKLGA